MSLTHALALLPGHLPDSVHELLSVISVESVATLIKTRAGTRIQMPHTIHAEHWLAASIGLDEARALCARYAGTSILIPRCMRVRTALRDAALLHDSRNGLSHAQIAQKHGMTERGVNKALRRVEKQEHKPWVGTVKGWGQADLFD